MPGRTTRFSVLCGIFLDFRRSWEWVAMKESHFSSFLFYCTEEIFYAILFSYEKEENSIYLCL
jgi:hypothetical protein